MGKTTALAHPPRKRFLRLYKSLLAKGHTGWKVFADFCELAAMSLANRFDVCEARESKYMAIARRYSREELETFGEMLSCVIDGLDEEVEAQMRECGKPAFPRCDFLGSLFTELELASHWRGQFFTPYHLCEMMAHVTISTEAMREQIEETGFVTVMEPACGAGAMVIAFASVMLEAGFNPQQHLHVTAIDVDQTAAYMAFIQFTLLGLPASVYVGNTISGERRGLLHTPFHHLGLWEAKLRRRSRDAADRTRAVPGSETGAGPESASVQGAIQPGLVPPTSSPSPEPVGMPAEHCPFAPGSLRADVELPPATQFDLFGAAA